MTVTCGRVSGRAGSLSMALHTPYTHCESSSGPHGSELIDDLAVRVQKGNSGRSVWSDL